MLSIPRLDWLTPSNIIPQLIRIFTQEKQEHDYPSPEKLLLGLMLIGSSSILSALPAKAFTPLTLTQTLNNPDPEASDIFGDTASVNRTNALIGAPGDNTGAIQAGSAYLFDTVTGNLLQTFNNPVPTTSSFFGTSVSVNNTDVLIGARNSSLGK